MSCEYGGIRLGMDLHRTKEAWKKFIYNDSIDNYIRQVITDSWRRCKKYSVDYSGGLGKRLSKELINDKLKENEELRAIARPIMKNLYNIVKGSGTSIILTDKEGYLLDVIGDKEIMERANELNFLVGALWTEEAVGTNAIGTALVIDSPVQTIGAEHYCEKHHSWSCSAAIIHDENNNIIGCLDMSGNYKSAHPHTLGMVLTGACSIEKQWELSVYNKLMNTSFESMSEGIIITDEKLKILKTNRAAENILKLTECEIMHMDIETIFKDAKFIKNTLKMGKHYYAIDYNLYIKNKQIRCILNTVPIKSQEKITGVVITFKDEEYAHKVANKLFASKSSYDFADIKTNNRDMKLMIEYGKKAAYSDCNILIEGPSGTGKELFAQSIHNYSRRWNKPFVAVNCASLPSQLIESELFGYEKGAFTGALKEGHPGKFELADGGTIFLDEIGELPLDMQAKLLRVLDNKTVMRIGGKYEKQLNVRIVAATNRNLKEEIKKKNFRQDLYYRLNVMNIKTTPLKERKEDIELLTAHFIRKLNKKNTLNKRYSENYMERLKIYNWPGNVRELQNVVQRSYYLCEEDLITEKYLSEDILMNGISINCDKKIYNSECEILTLDEMEKMNIQRALNKFEGNILAVSKILGISRATLYRKIRKYNLEV
ncbi:sigma-54-dependent Fis family transcriptional regulator [Haloimpatiens myeolchijeotgali]|uniref:sigma-54-dependent Fis family transcriptional regulator n=1 Tax=Haloimpatiens sp. FM7330 TaxID=3298610 RepID=UPI00384CE1B4